MQQLIRQGFLYALLVSFSLPVIAYEPGDFIFRAGIASVQPDEQAFGTLNTLNTGLGNDEQLGITFSYMLSKHLALGVLASTPFTHEITSNGSRIGEAKHLPPTLSLEYFPLDGASNIQPYIGAGINYTIFFSEESTLGDLSLDDSLGLSLEAGLDYHIAENIIIGAKVWKIDIDTDITLNGTDVGGVNIDPWVYMLSIGYRY